MELGIYNVYIGRALENHIPRLAILERYDASGAARGC